LSEILEYLCSNCGARLKVTPETIVAVCEYCGAPNIVSGVISRDDVFIVPSVGEGRVMEEFWSRVRRDMDLRGIAGEITPISVEGVYVPFWLSRVKVEGKVVYEVKRYEDNRVVVVTKRASFSKTLDVELVARRQVKHIGLKELIEDYLKSSPETIPLKELGVERWKTVKLSLLNLEFDRAEAERILREDSIDRVRMEWERKADSIKFFNARLTSMTKPRLIFLPLWVITYRYKGGLYSAFHEGWDGGPLVFAEPMLARRRIFYLLGMGGSVILGGISGLVAERVISGGGEGLVLPLFLLFFSALIGYFSAKRFISDVRFEEAWR